MFPLVNYFTVKYLLIRLLLSHHFSLYEELDRHYDEAMLIVTSFCKESKKLLFTQQSALVHVKLVSSRYASFHRVETRLTHFRFQDVIVAFSGSPDWFS